MADRHDIKPEQPQRLLRRLTAEGNLATTFAPSFAEDKIALREAAYSIARPADDGRLRDLAATALEAIEARIAAGDDPAVAVKGVVEVVFCACDDDSIDRPPFADDRLQQASALLSDPAAVERIAVAILDIIDDGGT